MTYAITRHQQTPAIAPGTTLIASRLSDDLALRLMPPRPKPEANGQPQTKPDTRTHQHKAYRAALRLQALVVADCENRETSPVARAQLIRAWDCLEERKRVLRGKPLPGSLRPEAKPRTRARGKLAPVEPSPVATPELPVPPPPATE